MLIFSFIVHSCILVYKNKFTSFNAQQMQQFSHPIYKTESFHTIVATKARLHAAFVFSDPPFKVTKLRK